MTDPKEQGKTYIDPETNKFVTEDTSGRKREATVDEIERTVKEWEQYNREGNSQSQKSNQQ